MNLDSSIDKVTGYDLENRNCIPDGSRDCRVQVEPSQTPTPSILPAEAKGLDLERQAEYPLSSNQILVMHCPLAAIKNAWCLGN
jgi:hypothetical protein